LGTAALGLASRLDRARAADGVRTMLERLEGCVRRVLRCSALGRALRRGTLARVLTACVLSVVSGCAIGHVLARAAQCLLCLLGQHMLPRMMRLRGRRWLRDATVRGRVLARSSLLWRVRAVPAIRLTTALGHPIDVRARCVGFGASHGHQRLLGRRGSPAAGIWLSRTIIRTA
jgi:hypothetical protein